MIKRSAGTKSLEECGFITLLFTYELPMANKIDKKKDREEESDRKSISGKAGRDSDT
jgi:hypothetical protein